MERAQITLKNKGTPRICSAPLKIFGGNLQANPRYPPTWFLVRMLIARMAMDRRKRIQARGMVVAMGGYSYLLESFRSSEVKEDV